MWEISNTLQILNFFRSVLLGAVYCFLYQFLRVSRRLTLRSDITVFFEDVIFCLLLVFPTFCFLLSTTNGELRGYIFLGLFVGFTAFHYCLSKVMVLLLFNLLFYLRKFLRYIFAFFCEKIAKKCINTCKKSLKKVTALVYNYKNKKR